MAAKLYQRRRVIFIIWQHTRALRTKQAEGLDLGVDEGKVWCVNRKPDL
jgi:hypothetical protein